MLKGIGVSEGIGIGTVLVIEKQKINFDKYAIKSVEEEIARYYDAIKKFIIKTQEMANEIAANAGEKESEILFGHIIMVQDPYMQGEIESLIKNGKCAEYAVSEICDSFISMFSSVDDELTNQRATDVLDIKNSLLNILLGIEEINLKNAPPNTVVVADILTPSMTSGINSENIVGIITENGGATSHSSIIARALGIPAVLSVENALESMKNGDTVIVDGSNGNIIVSPDKATFEEYSKKQLRYIKRRNELNKYKNASTVTADGDKKLLFCNIASSEEALKAKECTAEGIGLFRTELMFLEKSRIPTEDEQYAEYKRTALTFRHKPVKIRTLDIGGDKIIPYLNIEKEENPYLGNRAIRYCLKQEDIFLTQLRAILRASIYGKIKLMIPLVTCTEEVQAVKKAIETAKNQLKESEKCFEENLEIGIMIETPSAMMIADILAEEVDFFSIGTNDLTQYIMAVDRGNDDVSYLYSAFHPSVIRAIKHIIECGHKAGISVEMCGEAASDPLMIPLLIAFGLDEFSVSAAVTLKTRRAISKWSQAHAKIVAENVLKMKTEREIVDYLKKEAFSCGGIL
ncbi:MAG: phosphoenolpyruvate--protein phosphotransferase [Ruminococcus sp.]|nr:phosphoenolpyruvate--protein phosphotransferase [Ruminococcus sp.]